MTTPSEDFELRLIEAVKENPFLYDRTHPEYKFLNTKTVAWKEISDICNESVNRCVGRWKSLRDRYLREKKRLAGSKGKCRWIYYDQLSFLEKVTKKAEPKNKSPRDVDYGESSHHNQSKYSNSSRHRVREDSQSNDETMLDEPEIDFDIVGMVNRINDTIKAYKELASFRLQQSGDDNFGNLVADIFSSLTLENRVKARAHLVQYLTDVYLKQLEAN